MPAFRNVRRSRRLSGQSPHSYYDSDDDWEDHNLISCTAGLDSGNTSPSPDILSRSPSASPCKPILEDTSAATPRRSSHSRRRPKDHIPRPPNAFIIFRSNFWAEQREDPIERDHRAISRLAGHFWRNLPSEERAFYKERAEERKRLHARQYPGYKYAPVGRNGKGKKKKVRTGDLKEEERCRKVARAIMKRKVRGDLKPASASSEPSSSVSTPRATASSRRRSPRNPEPSHHHTTPEISPKEELSVPTLAMTTPSPVLDAESDAYSDGGFVPTSEIPPLDLSAPAMKIEEKTEFDMFDLTVKPSSFDAVGPQFGLKSYPFGSYTWYTPQGELIEHGTLDESDASSGFSSGFSNSSGSCTPILFTNPFAPPGMEKELSPFIGERNCEISGTTGEAAISTLEDEEMSQFFNFDQV